MDLKYKPSKEDLVAQFYLEPARGVSFKTAAEATAGESSIGTWVEVSTMKPSIAKKLKPTVFYANKRTKQIKIAYPKDLFENGNIPQILSSVAGNIFGMSIAKNLRLEDIDFPDSFIKAARGPKYGVPGLRKMLNILDRPLVGTIVKPKVGLDEKEHAKVAYNAWLGGLDVVKDDENLTSMTFNQFKTRVDLTLALKAKAERETGEKKIYLPNVTAPYEEMMRRARYVKRSGGESVMLDVLTVGFSGVQGLRNAELGLLLHGHRAMHAALTRNHKHGISMLTLAKISRLVGIDELHIGAIFGKMEGGKREVQLMRQAIEETRPQPNDKENFLGENWFEVKPMMAV
jgi:ribulose-bisphosphate carboxylase large chain